MLEPSNTSGRKKLFLLWCREKIPYIDKKTTVRRISIAASLLLLVIYVGGIVGQFIGDYQDYLQHGGLTGHTLIRAPDAHLFYTMQYALLNRYGHTGLLITAVFTGFLFGYFRLRHSWRTRGTEKDRNLTRSDKGTYGTAGWMMPQDMYKVLDIKPIRETKGTIYGSLINDRSKIVSLPINTRLNQNTAVYGISGSGKTTAFVINQILQCVNRGESIVMTDTKGDLYSETVNYVKSKGYTVRLFNLVDPEHSDSWNCLSEIEGNQLRAQTFVSTIMNNTSSGKDDYFWNNCEMNLLKSTSLYVGLAENIKKPNKHMGTVYDMFSLETAEMEQMFKELPDNHAAKRAYSLFRKSAEKVSGNVALGLGNRLQVFQSDMIRNITAYNEIDLSLPARQKCAYYVVISDQDRTFDFLSSLFFSFLFIDTIRFADRFAKHRGKCDVPIKIIFDEFNNIGMLPDFQDKISTIRSRLISSDIIFQNIPQLKLKYPNDIWQIILGNCDAQLFLGCTDPLTSSLISDRSGVVSVKVSGEQKRLATIRLTDFVTTYRQNSSVGKRMLLTADEVQRLPEHQALLILRGQNLLKLDKYEYWNHPEGRKLKPTNINDHIPDWYREYEKAIQGKKVQVKDSPSKGPVRNPPKNDAPTPRSTGVNKKNVSSLHAHKKNSQVDENQQTLFVDEKEYHPKNANDI